MTDKNMPSEKVTKPKIKRKSKGERKHIRRMKQAARKEAVYVNPKSSPAQPVQTPK